MDLRSLYPPAVEGLCNGLSCKVGLQHDKEGRLRGAAEGVKVKLHKECCQDSHIYGKLNGKR